MGYFSGETSSWIYLAYVTQARLIRRFSTRPQEMGAWSHHHRQPAGLQISAWQGLFALEGYVARRLLEDPRCRSDQTGRQNFGNRNLYKFKSFLLQMKANGNIIFALL